MSYSIDVYKGNIKAERHLGYFALYVTFFPQLVAGPIERASRLLPQLKKKVHYNPTNLSNGIKLVLIGLFKKVVIADRISLFVNEVYNNSGDYEGFVLILATIAFAIQIYCDFSGYSDIAIGSARMLGIKLMTNFQTPYFSSSLKEFWTRWHISLSQWFRDYVYIPLGGNRVVKWRWYYNLMITFLISGLWHGANWTFIVWGGIHGLMLVLETINLKMPDFKLYRFLKIVFVFSVVCLAWVFFRANTISDAGVIVSKIFSSTTKVGIVEDFKSTGISLLNTLILMYGVTILMILDWLNFKNIVITKSYLKLLGSLVLLFSIIALGITEVKEFIYFQF
ncbi:MBOAT family O-acyltransferase [Parvicella tangerina]|nr:MBOAT family O-acyltransferase [Parvicella tangerina]